MANRLDGHQVWMEDIKPRVMRPNRPSSKRQLGSTGIKWISPAYQRTDTKPPTGGTRSYSTLQTNSRLPSGKHGPPSRHTRPALTSQRKSLVLRQVSAPPKLQSQSSHSLQSSSVSGLGRLSNPIKLAPRPQSSMGLQRWSHSETPRSGLTPPQGFDLASYVKQHKSTKGIIIGRNGERTKDEYFDAYLTQCEEELCREHADSDAELELGSINGEEEINGHSFKSLQAPLCWDDQISQIEVSTCTVTL